MSKFDDINIAAVKKVAGKLGDLNDNVVYVGGAVVSIYADDPAADEVRPTKDVDITLEIASFAELTRIQEQLAEKGIYPAPEEKIMCRFNCDGILLDVMATKEVGWAQANEWFEPGFKHLESHKLDETQKIKVLSVAFFLASKFTAYHNRGKDPRTSHDFEDIIYILDNHVNLVNDILESPKEVQKYLISEFVQLIDKGMEEGILCHLEPESQLERFELLKSKLLEIIKRGRVGIKE